MTTDAEAADAPRPGFTPRKIVQQGTLGDLGPNVRPPPPREIPKRNKWARR